MHSPLHCIIVSISAIEAVAAATATAVSLVGGFIQRVDVTKERVITTSRITQVRCDSDAATGSVGVVGVPRALSSEDRRARKREAMMMEHECRLIGQGWAGTRAPEAMIQRWATMITQTKINMTTFKNKKQPNQRQ